MLVLSRKATQRIVLPSLGVTVEVLEIRGGRVRIGIDAPHDIRILRQEIAENRPGEDEHGERGGTARSRQDRMRS